MDYNTVNIFLISREKFCAKVFTVVTRYLRKYCCKNQRFILMAVLNLGFMYMVSCLITFGWWWHSAGGTCVGNPHIPWQPASKQRKED